MKASNGFHKIRTQFGVLTTQYRTDELEKCAVKVVEVNGWESDDLLTLREAARRFNNRGIEVSVCKCKSTTEEQKFQCVNANLSA